MRAVAKLDLRPTCLRVPGASQKLAAGSVGTLMAVFDLLKRLVNQNAAPVERRTDERVRASLGARVLVVDDSTTIRAVLGKMLLQDGYEVLKAPDGESAVAIAQTEMPDLIFLDIVLPGMSGFAVLRALRRDGRTRMTPIVMMSGNQQATEQFYVQRFGADGFVKKPFGRIDVFQAIRLLVQAGRMTARVEPAPVDAIPEGITREEWNAIPEIGMPDPAHLAAASPSSVVPVALTAQIPVGALPSQTPTRRWSMAAASLPMRPSISGRPRHVPGAVPSMTMHRDAVPGHTSAQETSGQAVAAAKNETGD